LKQCGIPTHPCGSSWGVLEKENDDGNAHSS
jgi:hypothetical protein